MSQAAQTGPNEQTAACPGCDSQLGVPALSAGSAERLLCCQNCGLLYTWPAAQVAELAALYPPGYYAHQPAAWAPGRWRALRSLVLQRYFGYPLPDDLARSAVLRLLRPAARLLAPLRGQWRTIPPFIAGRRFLDVGCGSGAYLARVRALGWQVTGIEPDAEACARARDALGLDVRCGTLEDNSLPQEGYDVITFWHSLEHTARPLLTLQQAYARLRPSGLIMLEVPNWASAQRRVFGRAWFHLDLPRHRLHFTARTLSDYLAKAGFVDVRVASAPSTVGVTGSLVRARRHNRALKAAFWLPEAVLSRAGLGGCLAATARKP